MMSCSVTMLVCFSSFSSDASLVSKQGSLIEGEALSTVGLLVQTSFDQLITMLQILMTSFYKTSYHNEEFNCTEPSPSVRLPWLNSKTIICESCLKKIQVISKIDGHGKTL
jgi:hypothetical protein